MPRLRFLRSLSWNRIRKWDCCPNCDYKIDVCLQLWLYIWLSCSLISDSTMLTYKTRNCWAISFSLHCKNTTKERRSVYFKSQ